MKLIASKGTVMNDSGAGGACPREELWSPAHFTALANRWHPRLTAWASILLNDLWADCKGGPRGGAALV